MTIETHQSYRDSGAEWLGLVPSHWSTSRTKVLFEIRKRIAGELGHDVLSVTQQGLKVRDIESNDGQLSMDYSKYQFVEPGDFVMNHMDLLTGYVDVSSFAGVTSPDYRVFAPRRQDISSRYFLYVFQNGYRQRILYAFGQGASGFGRWRMPTDSFNDFVLPLPPLPEQVAIAAFLDSETGKIDALMEEQKRLVELLKEKRQSVISHAVTKGLNPHATLKETGIEWLGEVPEHWSGVQLGRLCRQVSDGPHFSPQYVDDGVMFLSARNIKVDGWSLDDAKFVSKEDCAEFDRRVIPEKGDVLYTKGGTTGIARLVDLDQRFQVWVHVAVLKIDRALSDPAYVSYALNSTGCYEQSQLYTQGATNKDLGLTRMVKIWLALPPLDEQHGIVAYLALATSKFDELVKEAERAIVLLEERRAALISAAVTGKIDVRQREDVETAA